MDLFDSNISDCLYSEDTEKPDENVSLEIEEKDSNLDTFFNRGNVSLDRCDQLESIFEGYKAPDKFMGVEEGIIPSPASNRTFKEEIGGRVEVWGNSCKIDSNIKPYLFQEQSVWYREYNEYDHFDGVVRKKKSQDYSPPTRKKGDIKGLSKDSRRRLIKRVNKVDYQNREMPYWVTLTYPKRFPTEGKEYKADLDTFLKRLKRKFGDVEYIWRLEFQKRGAPHYHLILFLPEWEGKINYLRKWVSKSWYEVAQRFWDEKDEKHLKAGTNCKRIKNYRQLISYVSKYMGKCDDQVTGNPGRVWGASTNWGDHIGSVVISGKGLVRFIRIIRGYIKSQGSRKMAKYMAKNPNTEVFIPWSVVVRALDWIEDSHN